MLRHDGRGRRRSLIPTVATIIAIALLGRWLLWRQLASGPAAPTATKSPPPLSMEEAVQSCATTNQRPPQRPHAPTKSSTWQCSQGRLGRARWRRRKGMGVKSADDSATFAYFHEREGWASRVRVRGGPHAAEGRTESVRM